MDNYEYGIDPLDKAAYDTVHDFKNNRTGKKGAIGLSPVVDMNPSTLQNKANPKEDFSGFMLKEARKVMIATNDYRMLTQLNHDCGFIAVPVLHTDFPCDGDLLNSHLEAVSEFGDASEKMKKALNDKVLTNAEYVLLEKEYHEAVEKIYSLLEVLKGMAEPEEKVTHIKGVK